MCIFHSFFIPFLTKSTSTNDHSLQVHVRNSVFTASTLSLVALRILSILEAIKELHHIIRSLKSHNFKIINSNKREKMLNKKQSTAHQLLLASNIIHGKQKTCSIIVLMIHPHFGNGIAEKETTTIRT